MDDTRVLKGTVENVKVDGCTSVTTLLVMLLEPEEELWMYYIVDQVEYTDSEYKHQN